MDSRLCHARRRAAGRIGALVATVLVVPGLALAPAHAALSSTSLIPLPSTPAVTPQIDGMGSITGTGINCVNGTTALITCADSATLSELGSTLTGIIANPLSLTATPAPGWKFEGWSGSCTGTSPTCVLSASALTNALAGTPLAPVASFIPAGSGDPLPGTCEVGIADCTPPVTKLNSKPTVKPTSKSSDGAGVTQSSSATFTFQAFEPVEDSNPPVAGSTPTEGATFECKLLKKPATTPDFAACPGTTQGTASYTALTDGTYEFSVRAVDADGNKDATPETFTWTLDTTAPVTELNTRTKFWVLARKATFGLDVAPPDVASDMSFQCYLDGVGRQCPTVTFSSGTHTFGAAATDKAGNADQTRVTHTFTMPVNNTALGHSKGWTKAKVKGTFLNTASITKKKGARVATKASGIRRIALVASKGKGFGTVKVMLGKKTLKKVSLAHKRNVKKKVVPIAKFSTPVNGKITVQVVSSGKKVVIEGLGVATG
jgi:hypothetical protein